MHPALPVVLLLERIVAHAQRRREAVEGRLRRAHARPASFHHAVGLLGRQAPHTQRQPPRRGKRADLVVAEVGFGQRATHQLAEIGGGALACVQDLF